MSVIRSSLGQAASALNEITSHNTSIGRHIIRILNVLTINTTIVKHHLESLCNGNDTSATSEEMGAAFADMFTQNNTLQLLSLQEYQFMDGGFLPKFAFGVSVLGVSSFSKFVIPLSIPQID